MRIGQGIDAHAFSEDPNRALVLGGVVVPGGPGLAGHSDADVVCHALIDALLGAAGLGDLGRHFPSDDESLAGIASIKLLERALELLAAEGLAVVSADLTVVAQSPRLAPHLGAMERILSDRVGIPVSVKATTTDHLGFIGRAEGIAALAVALIEER
jgi:2-C-methyl-D-erythritol 2,4-cyclodiphosphate synthase